MSLTEGSKFVFSGLGISEDGSLVVNNSTLVKAEPKRSDITYKFVPLTEIATELGNPKITNVVSLGAFIKALPIVKKERVIALLKEKLTGKKAQMLESNILALEKGYSAVK